MSRNFTSEEVLIDQMLLDDTSAFEELYHRYCYSLYTYCEGKLDSPEDAKIIVRDIFIALWVNRHSLPVGFSISFHLYTEVRKSVIKCLNEKLLENVDESAIEKKIIPGFSLSHLNEARKPASPKELLNRDHSASYRRENHWWQTISLDHLKGMRTAFQSILNF